MILSTSEVFVIAYVVQHKVECESSNDPSAGSKPGCAGTSWILILLAILLNSLPWLRTGARAALGPGFVVAAVAPAAHAAPVFKEEVLNPDSPFPVAHVPSICELPDGRLAATWYAGSSEGARDVAIYFATQNPGKSGWSRPRAIVTRELAVRDLNRRLKKVGNPLLFSEDAGRLWLLYVTITVGGWSGSSLNVTHSDDEGLSWVPGRRLTLSPFFNLGELARGRPAALCDGSWAVPIYQELIGRLPELLWLRPSEGGWSATKSRIDGGCSGFQPSLAPLSTNTALAFLRDFSPRQRISVARTDNAGQAWSSPEVLGLPNPDAGLAALRLADGRVLLFFNDSLTSRHHLRLAVSADEGQTWTRLRALDGEDGVEASYPFAIQTRDGQVHLVYRRGLTEIKHVVFNEAWVSAQPGAISR
jgi:predicted neuraminidase